MQGPKVAVVVVSVFNTLNTIDCTGGGIFLKGAGIRLDSEISEVGPGKAVCLQWPLNVVRIEYRMNMEHIRLIRVTGAAILQLI